MVPLSGETIEWKEEASVCVVLASRGYPGDYKKGEVIKGLDEIESMDNVEVFHAGTALDDGNIVTDGGRVLGITVLGPTVLDAISLAYRAVAKVDSESLYYRTDIGSKALKYI